MLALCSLSCQVRNQVHAMLAMLCQCIAGTGQNFESNMAVSSISVTRMEITIPVYPRDADASSVWPAARDADLFALSKDAMCASIDSRWSFDKMMDFTERVFRGCLNLVAGPAATGHRVFEYGCFDCE